MEEDLCLDEDTYSRTDEDARSELFQTYTRGQYFQTSFAARIPHILCVSQPSTVLDVTLGWERYRHR